MGDSIRLIDTHVHINFDAFQGDIQQVAQGWRNAGVVRLVHSCVEPSEFPGIQALADQFPELSFAVGLHPLDVDQWTDVSQEAIAHLAQSDPRVVAIGETGLDLYKAENYEQQRLAFVGQLAIAHSMNLPVIIHCRDAAEPMLRVLRQFWQDVGAVSGVMHCWTGTPEETEAFLDLGFYISFSGIVTFKNALQVKESAKLVPGDRLLVETDCPFLSPVPKRSESRNQPAYVRYVAEYLAQLRGEPLEKVALQTTENACRLFSLYL
jgi:TatD DNase family protein